MKMWKNKNKKIIICPIFEQKNYDAFKMRKILKLDNIKKIKNIVIIICLNIVQKDEDFLLLRRKNM